MTVFDKSELDSIKKKLVDNIMINVHPDNGGIRAATKSHKIYGQDAYGYVWPRDGCLISEFLLKEGYTDVAKKFMDFMLGCQFEDGTFPQRVCFYDSSSHVGCWTDKSPDNDDKQLDQTASMLKLACRIFRDGDGSEQYLDKIRKMEDALLKYRGKRCFNLWEDRKGYDFYTTSMIIDSCYEAMLLERGAGSDGMMAGKLEEYVEHLIGSLEYSLTEKEGVRMIKSSINLCPDSNNMFGHVYDSFDSSTYMALVYSKWRNKTIFSEKSCLSIDDFYNVYNHLAKGFRDKYPLNRNADLCPHKGGVFMGRYLDDGYNGVKFELGSGNGNPWILTTADSVRFHLLKGDMGSASVNLKMLLDYGKKCDYKYPEQICKVTGKVREGMPENLSWSNASVGMAINDYMDYMKSDELI